MAISRSAWISHTPNSRFFRAHGPAVFVPRSRRVVRALMWFKPHSDSEFHAELTEVIYGVAEPLGYDLEGELFTLSELAQLGL
jgi:hypothetical protein